MSKINVKVVELKDIDLSTMKAETYYGFNTRCETIVDLYHEMPPNTQEYLDEGCVILKVEKEEE